ncbi:PHP domain-containing protein [Enemella sp. A6]|uniref:PHP domain-containing protein n=1 Tax=Enemella sp. A6 TaxID=3440152 RepID=UPI003EB76FBF
MRIDLHSHSTCSDGTDTPTEVVRRAARLKLDVLALTDHDTTIGWAEAAIAADEVGVEFVPGLEISTSHRGNSVHLLAYGVDPEHPELEAMLQRIRSGRAGRLEATLAKLDDIGVHITAESVRRMQGGAPSLGRPHVADALVEAGYVATRQEAFDRYLSDQGPAYVRRWAPAVAEAIAVVRDAGGLSLIAHPWGRGSREVLDSETLTDFVAAGLAGWEVDHNDHDEAQRSRLRGLAAEAGVLATGASDYHGLGKYDHELGCNLTHPAVWEEIRDRIG